MSTALQPISFPEVPRPINPSRRAWVAFIIVATILLVGAASFETIRQTLKITFRKLPVATSAPLISIAPRLGPWVQASVDRALSPDFEHELGTTEYVMRTYIDTRLLSDADLRKFLPASLEEREKMIADGTIRREPKGSMRFCLTYYTGSADTVPHVSERCFAADGWIPSAFEVVRWPVLSRPDGEDRGVDIRFMNFEDQIGSRAFRPQQVSYFFQVNGVYEQDPIFGVRKRLQNLLVRRAYFAKIELVTGTDEPQQAQPVMKDFLTFAMPEIERVLPDWEKVNAEASNAAASPTAAQSTNAQSTNTQSGNALSTNALSTNAAAK